MTVSLWLLDWAVRLRGIYLTKERTKAFLSSAFLSLLYLLGHQFKHSNSNGLTQSFFLSLSFFLSFFLSLKIEIKVIEWIFFKNNYNIAFYWTLDYRCTAKEFNKVWGKPHLFLMSSHWQLQPLCRKMTSQQLNSPRKVLSSLHLGKLAKQMFYSGS